MKRYLFLIAMGFLLTGANSAKADLTHRFSTSTQLSVDGSNIKLATDGHLGKLTAGTATTAATLDVGSYEINTAGSAFSFSEAWTQGDAVNPIGTGVDVSAGVVADMPSYGISTTQSGGVAGTLAGTITSGGVSTITAGGAGTTATGQFVSEVVSH